MARKYNKQTRLLSAYNRYVDKLNKRSAFWYKRGYTPVDTTPLSFADFVANRDYLRSRGVAAGNITNVIISQQLYQFNQAQAVNLIEALSEFGITSINNKKITVDYIKSGGGKEALSALNEALKASGTDSGYERAQFITETIYADSL